MESFWTPFFSLMKEEVAFLKKTSHLNGTTLIGQVSKQVFAQPVLQVSIFAFYDLDSFRIRGLGFMQRQRRLTHIWPGSLISHCMQESTHEDSWNELNDLYLKGFLYNKGREEYIGRCPDLLPSTRLAVKLKSYQFFVPAPAVGTSSSRDVSQSRPASTAVRSCAPDRQEKLLTSKYRCLNNYCLGVYEHVFLELQKSKLKCAQMN